MPRSRSSASERDAFETAMLNLNERQLSMAADYLRWLRSGDAPSWWEHCIFQGTTSTTPYDAYVMLSFEVRLALGVFAVACVHVGDTPAPDRARAENERALRQALPPQWRLDFGGYDDDGAIRWDTHRPNFIDLMPMREPRYSPSATLEVGSMGAHKAMLHMHRRGCLARWPYESEYLYIFENRGVMAAEPGAPPPEWDELVARRENTPLPGPAICCIDLCLTGALDLEPYRPSL